MPKKLEELDPTRASISCNVCGLIFQEDGDDHDEHGQQLVSCHDACDKKADCFTGKGCASTCHVAKSSQAFNRHSLTHSQAEHDEAARRMGLEDPSPKEARKK